MITTTKPKLLITNDHLDVTGGGTYVMMILHILRNHYELYTDHDIGYYSRDNTPWKLNVGDVHQYDYSFKPDLHLYTSFRGWIPPLGEKNIQITFFPMNKNIEGWNNFFVLNEFCASYCDTMWGGKSYIVTPCFNESDYYTANKNNTVINIGSYFYEQDGLSKYQHLVVEWFKNQNTATKLICHGMAVNPQYYEYVKRMSEDDPRIEIKCNSSQQEIRKDLSEAKYMVHAMGYGRSIPYEGEHFGLVAVEALLSGCQPFVHNSGGCKDTLGVITYNEFSDIVLSDTDPAKIREFGLRFSIENTEQQILAAINSIK